MGCQIDREHMIDQIELLDNIKTIAFCVFPDPNQITIIIPAPLSLSLSLSLPPHINAL